MSNATNIAAIGGQGLVKQYSDYVANINKEKVIGALLVTLLHPKSRGSVNLNGTSPYDKPKININFFDRHEDVETLADALNQQQTLFLTKAMRERGAQILRIPVDECDKFPYLSPAYQECYLKYFTFQFFHVSGTAKMGPSDDCNAVVDSRLRVYNVPKLRVIDTSM